MGSSTYITQAMQLPPKLDILPHELAQDRMFTVSCCAKRIQVRIFAYHVPGIQNAFQPLDPH